MFLRASAGRVHNFCESTPKHMPFSIQPPEISSSSISVRVGSWNISAVNNNPFEYWTSHPDPAYDALMRDVQAFIEDSSNDVAINNIFSDAMFSELMAEMEAQEFDRLQELNSLWTGDYRNRLAILGFLKDKSIGTKRLASMPDRITNTINLQAGGVCMRPSVINAYDGGSLASLTSWWEQWKHFMFHTEVQVFSESCAAQRVCNLIPPILRGKYPAISESEQSISIPLQILCLSILDAIFVHIMNSVAPLVWEGIRRGLCEALILGKASRICSIIESSYPDCEVLFLQEAAAVFARDAARRPALRARYFALAPRVLDGRRDQNSLILASRARFDEASAADVTESVVDALGGAWIAPGDLLVVSVATAAAAGHAAAAAGRWLLASFHGDSQGLSTQPLVRALRAVAACRFSDHVLLLGLDANTHSSPPAAPGPGPPRGGGALGPGYQQSVGGFAAFLDGLGLVSLWGPEPDPAAWTTCSSRTCLQTQLNKAVPPDQRFALSQRSLKDWVVAAGWQVAAVTGAARDNTGRRRFADAATLPSVDFPSDHAIVSAVFHVRAEPGCAPPPEPEAAPPAPAGRAAAGRERTLYDYWGIAEKPAAFHSGSFGGLGSSAGMRSVCRVVGDSGLRCEDEARRVVEAHYTQLAQNRHWNLLDRQKDDCADSPDRWVWILFSTRPYTMAIRKQWFRAMVFLAGTAFLANGALSIAALLRVSALRGTHFRFSALALRNGTAVGPGAAAAPSAIGGFGVLQGGCRAAPGARYTEVVEGLSMTVVSFPQQVSVDGWWFSTGSGPPEGDPTQFAVELSTDGEVWEAFPSPYWLSKSTLRHFPIERGTLRAVDLRAPVAWIFSSCIGVVIFSLACYASCAYGLIGMGRYGAVAQACGFLALSLLQLVWALHKTVAAASGIEAFIDFSTRSEWSIWFFVIFNGTLAVIAYRERYILDLFLLGFIVAGGIEVYIILTSSDALLLDFILLAVWWGLPTFTLVWFVVARHYSRKWVLQTLLAHDREKFDSVWCEICSKDYNQVALSHLSRLASKISKILDPSKPRQYHSQQITKRKFSLAGHSSSNSLKPESFSTLQFQKHPSFAESVMSFSSSPSRSRSSVRSLDQLMDQAGCINIYLKKKAKDLALLSKGAILVDSTSPEPNFQRYEENSAVAHKWLWANVKSADRAVEKLLRSYDCDVSLLLDCCRQTIVFDEISDLAACLSSLAVDNEIKFIRVKNMLDVNYDAWRSGGFRALILNICIENNSTKSLGVDSHVCELQLSLKGFASLVVSGKQTRPLKHKSSICQPWDGYDGQDETSDVVYTSKTLPIEDHDKITMRIDHHPQIEVAETGHVKESNAQQLEVESEMELQCLTCTSAGFEDHVACEDSLIPTLEQMLQNQFQISMTSLTRYEGNRYSGAFLKGKMAEIAVQRAANGSVWDTSHPFATLLCKRWFPWLLFAMILYSLFSLAVSFRFILNQGLIKSFRFRFTALELRGGTVINITDPGIQSIGILKNSCADAFSEEAPNLTTTNDGKMMLSFANPVYMNGWYFVTQNQPAKYDPIRFVFESSSYVSGDQWDLIASSSWTWTWAGLILWETGGFQTTLERGATESFDLSVPWIWAFRRASCNLVQTAMFTSILVAGSLKHYSKGKGIAILFSSIYAAINGISCLLYALKKMWEVAFVAGGVALIDSGLPLTLIFSERCLRYWIGVAGIGYELLIIIHFTVLFHRPSGLIGGSGLDLVQNAGLLEGFCYICLFAIAYITRSRSRQCALSIIKDDWEAYDKCWATLSSNQQHLSTFEEMYQFSSRFCTNLRKPVKQPIRSTNVEQNILEHLDDRESKTHNNFDDGYLIHRLEQLFAQSAVLDIFLRVKAKEWAQQFAGCFQIAKSFVPWEEIQRNSQEKVVRWATVKSPDRALEKLFRVYNLDVSRLLDCCRQSVYFQKPTDLFECLKAVCNDNSIQVLRVINRLHNSYDSSTTAGYRDIMLNLTISNEDTRRLRIDAVICELQLSLIEFACIKSEEGHARYVQWRNQRGQ